MRMEPHEWNQCLYKTKYESFLHLPFLFLPPSSFSSSSSSSFISTPYSVFVSFSFRVWKPVRISSPDTSSNLALDFGFPTSVSMRSTRLLFKPPNLVYFCYGRETVLSLCVPMTHAWVITMRAVLWPQEWTFHWSNQSRFCWKRITLFFPLGLELWRCKLLLPPQGKIRPTRNQYREGEHQGIVKPGAGLSP